MGQTTPATLPSTFISVRVKTKLVRAVWLGLLATGSSGRYFMKMLTISDLAAAPGPLARMVFQTLGQLAHCLRTVAFFTQLSTLA